MKLIHIGHFMVSRGIVIRGTSKHFGKRVLYFWWKNKMIFPIYLWKVKV